MRLKRRWKISLGGVSVLGDEVIRVGDFCRFGDKVGTVEDISLRSTRVRTTERTQLSIPNGSLATMNLENFSRRDKILLNTKLGPALRDYLPTRCVTCWRKSVACCTNIPKWRLTVRRNRFISFDESALTMEIFCYILTQDYSQFLTIKEDILLRIMDIVDAAGTGFAFPSQTVYLGRDTGLDKEKAEWAAGEVQKWREGHQLPFPDFPPDEISEISNSLPYPQPGSAVVRKDETH